MQDIFYCVYIYAMNEQRVHKLVLHPSAPGFALPSWDRLIRGLQAMEFLDKAFANDSDKRYLVGERFLQYITFMGCSPSVELTPPANGSLDFCHVRFSDIYTQPRFRRATQSVFARCPHCRKRMNNWETAISHWLIDPHAENFQCDKCANSVSVFQVGWRHTAAFACLFMDIYSIYPQEGIPTDQFLSELEALSGCQWNYFFTDQ